MIVSRGNVELKVGSHGRKVCDEALKRIDRASEYAFEFTEC